MNLEKTKKQILTANRWQEKSYLLNKVFANKATLFPVAGYQTFTEWLESFEEVAKNEGLSGYSFSTLTALRTTGGFYISFLHNVNFEKEIKNKNGTVYNLISCIKDCKVKSYKALHMVSTKKKKPSPLITKLIHSGELERKHVTEGNNVTPLITKLKKELKGNQKAMSLLISLEKAV